MQLSAQRGLFRERFKPALHEKRSYSEFFCFLFFRIWTEYGEYSVQMWKDTDQKNSEYGYFLCSSVLKILQNILQKNIYFS